MKRFFTVLVFFMLVAVTAGCKGRPEAGMKTVDNLKAAIIGETTASASYAAFAQKAKDEGYGKIASLFLAASRAESIHAKNHTDVLKKLGKTMEAFSPKVVLKSTKENLEAAIKGENHEVVSMYPEFITTATAEKQEAAVTTFNYAIEVEKIHRDFYTQTLDALNKKDFKKLSDTYAVCPVCGNTFGKDIPAICPICGAAKSTFITI